MHKAGKREVRYLYPFILKSDGYIVDVKKAIGFYDRYNAWARDLAVDPDCPSTIRKCLILGPEGIRMPNYLKWARSRLVDKEK